MQPVEKDGASIGEIFIRGNIVMKGYLKNYNATKEVFEGGWFRTGDLAVWHPDGYIEIKDRSKDIIISGGENISSIEVEDVLYRHPDVEEAAVVARPDEKWGETPCAFIKLKPIPTLQNKIWWISVALIWLALRCLNTSSLASFLKHRPVKFKSLCCVRKQKKHKKRLDKKGS